MKSLWAVCLCGLAVAGWARLSKENSLQLELLPGQALKLELSSGDYRIEPGAGNQVVVISQENAHSRSSKECSLQVVQAAFRD